MAPRPKNVVYISVQLTNEEKHILDTAVEQSGKKRNRYIRDWIATLARRP